MYNGADDSEGSPQDAIGGTWSEWVMPRSSTPYRQCNQKVSWPWLPFSISLPKEWLESWKTGGIKLISYIMRWPEMIVDRHIGWGPLLGKISLGLGQDIPSWNKFSSLDKWWRGTGQQRKASSNFCKYWKGIWQITMPSQCDWMQNHGVSSCYIRIFQNMYWDAMMRVKTAWRIPSVSLLRVGVHQVSALSTFLSLMLMKDLMTEVDK